MNGQLAEHKPQAAGIRQRHGALCRPQVTATDLAVEDTTRTGEHPDLRRGLQMQSRVGSAGSRQDLDRGTGMRYSHGVVPRMNGEAEICQDGEEQPQQCKGLRSLITQTAHLHSILRLRDLQCKHPESPRGWLLLIQLPL